MIFIFGDISVSFSSDGVKKQYKKKDDFVSFYKDLLIRKGVNVEGLEEKLSEVYEKIVPAKTKNSK